MPDFVKELFINKTRYTFLFRSIMSPKGEKYFVSAYHQIEEQVSFEMVQQYNHRWKVIQPAPEWIVSVEEQLSTFILLSSL